MNEDKRASGAISDERCCYDGLAKGCRRGKHAVLMASESLESRQLRPLQFTTERHTRRNCRAEFTFVFQFGNRAMAFDEIKCLL